MTKLTIDRFICRQDNYAILINDSVTNQTIAIDAPDHQAISEYLERHQRILSAIFLTHSHYDHIEGVNYLKERYDCKIHGSALDIFPFKLDIMLFDNDIINFNNHEIRIIENCGHSTSDISYYFINDGFVCVGDSLFSLGCGRVNEGIEDLFKSLCRLYELPDNTKIYPGHEYSKANLSFLSFLENNPALSEQLADKVGQVTDLAFEKSYNPFLRFNEKKLQKKLSAKVESLRGATPFEIFKYIRFLKDNFKS